MPYFLFKGWVLSMFCMISQSKLGTVLKFIVMVNEKWQPYVIRHA